MSTASTVMRYSLTSPGLTMSVCACAAHSANLSLSGCTVTPAGTAFTEACNWCASEAALLAPAIDPATRTPTTTPIAGPDGYAYLALGVGWYQHRADAMYHAHVVQRCLKPGRGYGSDWGVKGGTAVEAKT